MVALAGANEAWSSAERAPVGDRGQPERDKNREECHPATRPEDPLAGSQHGEFLLNASEGIGVRDGVKAALEEWEIRSAGADDRRPAIKPVRVHALHRCP
jgi:hypothetical protein